MIPRLLAALVLLPAQQPPGRGPGAGEFRGELRDKQGPLMRVAMSERKRLPLKTP